MTKIQTIIQEIAGLKPVSRVAHRIMAILRDPESSMSDLSRIIAYDAMATANVLKAANSAYYGRSRKFDDISQALVFLGMDEVADLVLLNCCKDNIYQPQQGYDLPAGDLWRYAASSALLARKLAVAKSMANTHLIFTAALLKDIGKVVLEQYVHQAHEKIKALVVNDHYSFREAEKAVLGVDHAELGAMVARVWQFSPMMVDIIGNHHHPNRATRAKRETAVVHTSDILCMMMGINAGWDALAYRFDQDAIEQLGISDTELQQVIAGFSEELKQAEDLIS